MLDCCPSGGMTRDGGPRIRGLTPPDDIRHRALRWEASEGMWAPRELPPLNESLSKSKNGADYLGDNGATQRLGRSMALRTQPDKEYNKTRAELGHHGPYLPILLEACQEQEPSYEYRDGVTAKLRRLKYNQTPNLVGAKKRVSAKIPWGAADAGRGQRRAPKKRAAKTGRKKRR
ncbi:hypothetical protein [Bradyrhizobium sp. Arg816]|uniref:hypothetical protein n=1 Tax=Bradyrhizobium sp. Arg816 TaxID=2998491 RepID=UPI00249ED167|nr:hypothetical protein [Bradyrhizobium sp. Arg816]MDI3558855.1 hypothetical protein [Bradyrhizobium sp. Arg816]